MMTHLAALRTAQRPLVSVVTAVLNEATTLERTIQSVLAQSYRPIEYIIIDGCSADGSREIIERYADHLAYWTSEPDRGISDAFGKGIARSQGDYISLLNADDWLSPDQIEIGVAALEESGADFVFGDLMYHVRSGEPLHIIRGDPNYRRSIHRVMPAVNHPTMLVRREVYLAVGGFDLRYRAAMDYDWLLRAHRAGYEGRYEPRLVGHMTLEGTSDRHFVRSLSEVREIAIRYGQSAWAGWVLYAGRILKGLTRRQCERLMPSFVHGWLRSRVNRHYHPLAANDAERRPTE